MNFHSRLALACAMYDRCTLAADIGTDHAHLPIALLRGRRCDRMILTDVSPDALRNARENIAQAGLSSLVDFRLGDGLAPLTEACGMISILGMGGRTIRQILTRGQAQLRGAGLLLSAHTDVPLVRQTVQEIGYHLTAEEPCFDAGRFYVILRAAPGPKPLSPREVQFGKKLFESASPFLRPYLARQVSVLEARLDGLQKASSPDSARQEELADQIRWLRSFL